MSYLLIGKGIVVTDPGEGRILLDGGVVIKNGFIEEVGDFSCLKTKHPEAILVNAQDRVIMPAFINLHMHLYSTFALGISLPSAPENFLGVLKNLWWRLDKALDPEDIYYSALVVLIEAAKCGTTTIFDHHASPWAIPGSLDYLTQAFNEVGLRGALCYEVSDRDGKEIARAGIKENLRYLQSVKGDLKALFGLHASFTISDATLKECVEVGSSYGAGFHLHAAEDQQDQVLTEEKYGQSVIERFYKAGVMGPKTILAHGIHLTPSEWDFIRETDSILVHNPESNMKNAVGYLPVEKLMERDVLPGLGTDGMSPDMLREVRLAFLLSRDKSGNPKAGFSTIPSLLLKNNPVYASRFFSYPFGKIEKGAIGDLIVMDYLPPTPLNENNWLGHFIYGITKSKVNTTIAKGIILLRNGEIKGIDEDKIRKEASFRAKRLWERW